jgi:hypothetical protein
MIIQILGGIYIVLGLLIFVNYRDKDRIGDLYGSINLFTFGLLTIYTDSWEFIFMGFIVGWLLRLGGYDHSFSNVNFKVPDRVISLVSLFDLITVSILNETTTSVKEKCLSQGMFKIDMIDIPSDLPDYNERYLMSVKTNNREVCLVEIIGRDETIIQIGVQIFFRKTMFMISNLNEHSYTIDKLYTNYFGSGDLIGNDLGMDLVNYRKDEILGYTNKFDSEEKKSLIFRVGNIPFFPSETMT